MTARSLPTAATFPNRSGSGGPAVVLLPGAGLVGPDFLNIQAGAAEFTTSVLYDRAGTGWSEPATLPRTPTEVTVELRDLLLLLDPGHEDILAYMSEEVAGVSGQLKPDPEQLPDHLTEEQVRGARKQWAQLYAHWPTSVRERLIEHNLASWRTSVMESLNFETEVYEELRGGGALPDVPLMVLTAGGTNPYWAQMMPERLLREAHDGLRALHAAMTAVVPRGEHREIAGASHQYLHIEHPDAVLDALRKLHAKA
ncbi:alpha/beta hydrolase [Streptomyces sp. NPDC048442]|uniref:alpha/beta fold hydrolase n=1 Tax=Streptomyces sp. NPDC048442 TaxID=3154823 RepID=UPI00343EE1BF